MVLLGVEIGELTIKALMLDSDSGLELSLAVEPTPALYPAPGWSEHPPDVLWDAVCACIRKAVRKARAGPPVALALSSPGGSGLPMHASGSPLYPIIGRLDTRSQDQLAAIGQYINPEELQAVFSGRTGAAFDIARWMWIREHLPFVAENTAHWLPISSYIYWRLTGEQAVDHSTAGRTGWMDSRTNFWSGRMLELADLQMEQLPGIRPGGTQVGWLLPVAAELCDIPVGTPCFLGGLDNACAALAATARVGDALVDLSESAETVMVLQPSFCEQADVLSKGYSSMPFALDNLYLLRGELPSAGSAIQWLARQLNGAQNEGELPYRELMEAARQSVGKRAGPVWLPHLAGSGSPENDAQSQAAFIGLDAEHGPGDIFRGLLEGLACWLRYNVETLQRLLAIDFQEVVLLGGTTGIPLLTQLKADVLGKPIAVVHVSEPAATGAALLAGVGAGVYTSHHEAVQALSASQRQVLPDPGRAEWYDRLYQDVYLPLYETVSPLHQRLAGMNRRWYDPAEPPASHPSEAVQDG